MPVLTVRRHDCADVTGDTVRPDGDELRVLGRGETVTVPLSDVRAIIAGEPANPDEPARDEGVVLADGGQACESGYSCGPLMDLDGPEMCSENHGSGPLVWMCTRPEGHDGPHVACGGRNAHNFRSWEAGDEPVAVTDGGSEEWNPQPATLREGETRDDAGHTRRNNEFVRDSRKRLATLEHLSDDSHLCDICGFQTDDLDLLDEHTCHLSARRIVERTEGGSA